MLSGFGHVYAKVVDMQACAEDVLEDCTVICVQKDLCTVFEHSTCVESSGLLTMP